MSEQAQRGRWWLSFDLAEVPLLRPVIMCEGDYRRDELRTLEVGLNLGTRCRESIACVTVDLRDTPLERPVAETYWAVVGLLGRVRRWLHG